LTKLACAISATKPLLNPRDLSLAYSRGVAAPREEIVRICWSSRTSTPPTSPTTSWRSREHRCRTDLAGRRQAGSHPRSNGHRSTNRQHDGTLGGGI